METNAFDSISKEQEEFNEKHYGHIDSSMTLSKCFTKQPYENIAEKPAFVDESSSRGEDMSKI